MDMPNDTAIAPRILYLVQRLHWRYNDEYYEPYDDEPIRAFANREAAEVYRRALEYNARDDQAEKPDEYGYALLPRDDPNMQLQIFEVVEMEWHG